MYYWQNGTNSGITAVGTENVYKFPTPPLDLAFDDTVLDTVEGIWRQVESSESSNVHFLAFEDRAGETDDNEEL
jgi:hypothetical protein